MFGRAFVRLAQLTALAALAAACQTNPTDGGERIPDPLPGSAGSSSGGGPSGSGSGGTGTSGGTGASGDEGTRFSCDPNAKAPASSLRRLTMNQYRNQLADLVAFASGSASEAAAVLNELATPLARLPSDHREPTSEDIHGSYRRLDQSLQQLHVDAYYDVAVAAGAALTQPARLSQVVGACAVDQDASNDAACLSEFIARFGARALRRPLDADEVAFYTAVYGVDPSVNPAAYADVIGVLLNAPQMVYFVEHGGAEVPGRPGAYELSAYELASRLSFQIWQTAPDAALLEHAADGSLLESQTYRAEVERLLADPRARPALDEFIADWLKVEDLPQLQLRTNDVVYAAFAGSDGPNPRLRKEMIDDVLGLVGYYTWHKPSPLATLLQTERSFARSPELARLYGVAPWDGGDEPPLLPEGQRPGLLTRTLFLSTGSPNTRPIMKGLFIRKQILCDSIPPPPPGANAKPPALEPGLTTRETVEQLTQMRGTICAGCHTTLINPLGFATENFDALGRFRTEQAFFDEMGQPNGSKPIDTRTVPHVLQNSEAEVAGPLELMQQIASSGKLEACLSRNFFRYTFARWEDLTADGCTLEGMRNSLEDSGTLLDLVVAASLADSFKQRVFE